MVRILIVDDYQPWRLFVCSALRKHPGLEIVGEAADGGEALQKAVELQADMILLDIGLPTLNGIEVARQLRINYPTSRILFVSQECSPEIIDEALSTGARGYVVKANAGDLLDAVNRALAA